MKLSIVVPVYNAEAYLRTCLDSLESLKFDDYEAILVDDGSTDSSSEICEEYKKNRPDIFHVIHVKNGGQGRARNIALEMAQGDYIGFVDSDDYVSSDMYQKLYAAARKEQADIAVCAVNRIDEKGQCYDVFHDGKTPLSAVGAVWDKLFRRELIQNIRFPEGLWYEDFEFSGKALLMAQKIVFLREPLYYYRCGHVSTMNNANSVKNLDIIKILDHIRKYGEENGKLKDNEFQGLVLDAVVLDAINRVSAQKTGDRKTVIRKLRDYAKSAIPDLMQCGNFLKEPTNRKIIMWLNYNGLSDLSASLLKLKKIMTH